MKIVIAGGTGQIGQLLKREYDKRGFEVVILTRHPQNPGDVAWDGETLGDWQKNLEGADAVINLAGRTVNCRYTPENLKQMMDSRVKSTQVIGEAIRRCSSPPPLWLQMSTATLYEHSFDHDNDEETGIIGGQEAHVPEYWSYSVRIGQEWENALFRADTPHTRKVALRSAMVMSPDQGGVFMELANLAKKGLGGPIAGGQQFMSWIHEKDFIGALDLLMSRNFQGVINLAAPHPLPQRKFMKILRDCIGMPIGLPATRWMAEIGAYFLKTDTELVLKSRRVISKKLKDMGYVFQFPRWEEACRDLSIRSGQYLKKHYYRFALLAFFFTFFWPVAWEFFSQGMSEEFIDAIGFIAVVLLVSLPVMILAIEITQPFFRNKIYGHTNNIKTMVWSHLSASTSVFVFTYFISLYLGTLEIHRMVENEYYHHIPRMLLFFLLYVPCYGVFVGLPATLIFATWMGLDANSKNLEAYQR